MPDKITLEQKEEQNEKRECGTEQETDRGMEHSVKQRRQPGMRRMRNRIAHGMLIESE